MICDAIRRCDVSTVYNSGAAIVAVGITRHDNHDLVTCCVRDPILGCQHVQATSSTAVVLIERLARAFVLRPRP